MEKDSRNEGVKSVRFHPWTRELTTIMNQNRVGGEQNRWVIDVDAVMKTAILKIKGVKNDAICRLVGIKIQSVSDYINKQINGHLLILKNEYKKNINIQVMLNKYKVHGLKDLENFTNVFNDALRFKDDPQKLDQIDIEPIKKILDTVGVAKSQKRTNKNLLNYGDMSTYLMIKKIIELYGGNIGAETDQHWERFLETIKEEPSKSIKELAAMGINFSDIRNLYLFSKVLQSIYATIGSNEAEKVFGKITEKDELQRAIKLMYNQIIISLTSKIGLHTRIYNDFILQLFDSLAFKINGRDRMLLVNCSNQVNGLTKYCTKVVIDNPSFIDDVINMYNKKMAGSREQNE